MSALRRTSKATTVFAAAFLVLGAFPLHAGAAGACAAPVSPMTFTAPSYVDEHRAGGEPMIQVHPDGTILYAAHAGTTHFYARAAADPTTTAFVENYRGQTYVWWSADDGKTWTFVPRDPPANAPMEGFSDPDFAIDADGNVYLSEINLVNVAMSKSTDRGRSFALQNFFAQTITDRQWSEADRPGEIYLIGNAFAGGTFPNDPVGNLFHNIYKSTDGGATFTDAIPDPNGRGDLRVDHSDGTLYEANYSTETHVLGVSAFRNARGGDLQTRTMGVVAESVNMLSHWPALDVDPDGNLVIVWDESGPTGTVASRPAGVYYAYSTDRGKTWSAPVRVDPDDRTDIWPWVTTGEDGRVAVSWFQADVALSGSDAEQPGTHGWNVMVAQTLNGLGCADSPAPGFNAVRATPEPFHTGTVCMSGTTCQTVAIDRRLGDYFAIDIDGEGMLVAAYSDTRQGGAVSLPAFLRQTGGPSFKGAGPAVGPTPKPGPTPTGAGKPGTAVRGRNQTRELPRTGVADSAWPAGGAALLAAAALLRRRSRPA